MECVHESGSGSYSYMMMLIRKHLAWKTRSLHYKQIEVIGLNMEPFFFPRFDPLDRLWD